MNAPGLPYAIPERIRTAALRIAERWRVEPGNLVEELAMTYGFTTLAEISEVLHARGQATADKFVEVAMAGFQRERGIATRDEIFRVSAAAAPEVVIAAVPDDWFVKMVEWSVGAAASSAWDLNRSGEASDDVRDRVDELFANSGIPYAFEGRDLRRTSDSTAAAVATQPALGLLDDPRLADARRYMLSALEEFQKHEPAEAIDEARHVVEAAMLAVIADREEVGMPDSRQPQQLFNTLKAGGVVTGDIEELVLAAPRLRGRTEAGHSGGRPVDMAEAEAAIASAASAVVYLTSKLS